MSEKKNIIELTSSFIDFEMGEQEVLLVSIDNLEKFILESKKYNATHVSIEVDIPWSESYIDDATLCAVIIRKETDEEYELRKSKEEVRKNEAKEERMKKYLRLKQEFENE